MEHLEFIDRDHFQYQYHRRYVKGSLSTYIDFCWETDFDTLLSEQPEGFVDVLFPNIGYTYLINLGTPFTMQLQKNSFIVKNDGFLPRHHYISCHHSAGNKVFGIKFKVCPILFEKQIDFSEYKEQIYPLAYLIDRSVVHKVKNAASFNDRVNAVIDHYDFLLSRYIHQLNYVKIVAEIIDNCIRKNEFDISIQQLADQYHVSTRTMQRYFNATTSFSSKQAMQTMRIRQAVKCFTGDADNFRLADFGYYDYSHFTKHLQQFTGDKYFSIFREVYRNRKQTAH